MQLHHNTIKEATGALETAKYIDIYTDLQSSCLEEKYNND